MSKIVEFKYSIEEAFQQCYYVVPHYQREYVWETENVTALLEDIYEQGGVAVLNTLLGIFLSPREKEKEVIST